MSLVGAPAHLATTGIAFDCALGLTDIVKKPLTAGQGCAMRKFADASLRFALKCFDFLAYSAFVGKVKNAKAIHGFSTAQR